MFTVKWLQHAVGHGGFHSGRAAVDSSPGFNWIFDCGSLSRLMTNEIMYEWTCINQEPLDWLFISHFDMDHVSALDTLMSRAEVRDVMVPYVNEHELVYQLLHEIDRDNLDRFFVEIVADPAAFFLGRGADRVTFLQGDERPSAGRESKPFSPDDDRERKGWKIEVSPSPANLPAPSGFGRPRGEPSRVQSVQAPCKINATSGTASLGLRPYRASISRHAHQGLLQDIRLELGVPVLTVRPGLGRLAYAIGRHARTATGRASLRRLFHRYAGTSNRSSLSLLSAPVMPNGEEGLWRVVGPRTNTSGAGSIAWMNTGDAELLAQADVESWRAHYDPDLASVRMLALPHHGSDRNSDHVLAGLCPSALLVAHAGADSRHHPGAEVSHAAGARLAIVTEYPATEVQMEFVG